MDPVSNAIGSAREGRDDEFDAALRKIMSGMRDGSVERDPATLGKLRVLEEISETSFPSTRPDGLLTVREVAHPALILLADRNARELGDQPDEFSASTTDAAYAAARLIFYA